MAEQENEVLKKPQDVLDMEKVLGKYVQFMEVIRNGTFQGKYLQDALDLKDHLKSGYDKQYALYRNHPFIKPLMGEQEENA